MNDTRRIPEPLRVLDGLEVALRGLNANLERARPVLDGLQRDHSETVAAVYGELESCDFEAALNALVRLKATIERARR